MSQYLVVNVTLTSLKCYLNEKFKKRSGREFTVSDIQGYLKRGNLPKYLGGNKIELNKEIISVRLYNVYISKQYAESIH